MASQTKTIISTVGPFMLYGTELVATCAYSGTNYADTTGEDKWVGAMIEQFDEVARKTGQINVAKHEFLHKIMNAKVGDTAAQSKMVKGIK